MMTSFNPHDFGEILENIKGDIEKFVDCYDIRPIESNFNTKGMMFKHRSGEHNDGTIVVGEDRDHIAVDITIDNGKTISATLHDKDDLMGVKNIVGWFHDTYSE